VSEKRVLKRMFGHKSEEVIGGWKILQDEETLHQMLLG
jgi:hypothetical protein